MGRAISRSSKRSTRSWRWNCAGDSGSATTGFATWGGRGITSECINEAGKGDHRHVGADEVQVAYEFSSLEKLLNDFRVECEQLGWRWSE